MIGDGWINVCSLSTLKYVNLHQFSYTGSTLTPTLGKSLRYSYMDFEPSVDGFNFCSLVFNDPVTTIATGFNTQNTSRGIVLFTYNRLTAAKDAMITDFAGSGSFLANFMYFPGLRLHAATGEITFGYSVIQSIFPRRCYSSLGTCNTLYSSLLFKFKTATDATFSTSDYMCFSLPTKSTTDFVNIVLTNNLPIALAADTSKTTRDFTFAQSYNDFALTV